MPNIRSQRIDADGLELVTSDGRVFAVTAAQIRARHLADGGRRDKVRAWLRLAVKAALGCERIGDAEVDFDYDANTGVLTSLTIGGEPESR